MLLYLYEASSFIDMFKYPDIRNALYIKILEKDKILFVFDELTDLMQA